MTELVPGLHWLEAGMANVYLYGTGAELTLVDSGAPGQAQKILDYVHGIGREPSDLKRILVTHADWDHAGSVSAVQKETGAQVIATPTPAPPPTHFNEALRPLRKSTG